MLSAVEIEHNNQMNGCWPCATCVPGKSYRAVRTVEFYWRTSENPYVIASIELRSTIEKSCLAIKIRDFPLAQHFLAIFLLRCVDLAFLAHFHPF
jgi:hypothetical protein